jgi:predicted regulator of Ras-like GTPase activity (Roadblock/LC7/MglB family)
MSDFRNALQSICSSLPGTVAVSLMSFDGLPLETVETGAMPGADEGGMDLGSLLVEYSTVLAQVQRTGEIFSAGPIEELSIRSENLTTLIRPVNTEYFVALAMRPEASLGRGRYLLRVHAPRLVDALT